MVDDSHKGSPLKGSHGGNRRVFQEPERSELPDWPEPEEWNEEPEFGDDSGTAAWNDDSEWGGESEILGTGDWAIEDGPLQERIYDSNVEDSSNQLPPAGIEGAHQAPMRTEEGMDQGLNAGHPATERSGARTDSQQRTRKRQRLIPLAISAVFALGLVVGGSYWWEQKNRPLSEPDPLSTSLEPAFLDPAALSEPDPLPPPSEPIFLDPVVLEEQRLKYAVQQRLSDPKVAVVFYFKDRTTEAERVIQPLDVTDLKRTYRTTNELRGALHQESLSDHERKRLAEAVLDDAILDFGAGLTPHTNRSSHEAEIDRRIKRIAAVVQSDSDFEQWITINYGSRAALRNKVERSIMRQEYLARNGLSKQEAVESLRGDLEIIWADSP